MSDFDRVAAELAEQARAQAQQKEDQDRQLLLRVLEIYDQKTVAATLRKVSQQEWTRESVNRWVKGNSRKMLSEAAVSYTHLTLPTSDLV